MNKSYIKITDKNRMDIIRTYAHEIADSMDTDSLYSFVYSTLVENKEYLCDEDLTKEIMNFYPHILESTP